MLQGAADEMLVLASRHFFKYREPVFSHIKSISWCHLTRFNQGVTIFVVSCLRTI